MWNVLKGDMHLIGPRPERKCFVEEYEEKIPYYEGRYQVAPGVTGWAQVNYPYGSNLEDTRQKLMYDLYYVRNWSIWLELKIVWMTAKTVISGKGI
jgi:lipopolysaccharide/colanic/teichoic acid biosynthesis glycosyltransferase